MHDISAEGITTLEDIHKKREPLSTMEAIYFLTPCVSSVQSHMTDFASFNSSIYREAHVNFTEACPNEVYNQLCRFLLPTILKF
jgi:syntaxin-binding protein 1